MTRAAIAALLLAGLSVARLALQEPQAARETLACGPSSTTR